MTSTKLLFDVAGLNLADAIRGIAWRLDPVRSRDSSGDENVIEIAVQNADSVEFEEVTAEIITEISNIDADEAVVYAEENFHILLVTFLRTMLDQRFSGKISMSVPEEELTNFTAVDIPAELAQYRKMEKEKKIENSEGTKRFRHRGTKAIMNDTITPLFTHLSAGIHRLTVKSDKEFSGINKEFADIKEILGRIEKKR